MLINPLLSEDKKSVVLKKLFRDKLDPITYHFLILLCTKKRSNILSEVIDRFFVLLYDYKGILKGKIISAHHLPSDQVEQINSNIKVITGKSVELELETDASLIAGFIVKIKDTVIDMSVKNQLEKLREKLVYG
jgi:F-type H+-transporting ATPase subunit delta